MFAWSTHCLCFGTAPSATYPRPMTCRTGRYEAPTHHGRMEHAGTATWMVHTMPAVEGSAAARTWTLMSCEREGQRDASPPCRADPCSSEASVRVMARTASWRSFVAWCARPAAVSIQYRKAVSALARAYVLLAERVAQPVVHPPGDAADACTDGARRSPDCSTASSSQTQEDCDAKAALRGA